MADGPQDEIATGSGFEPRAQADAIDWNEISRKYAFIRTLLEDFRVPTKDEQKHYKISLLIGKPDKTPFLQKERLGWHSRPGSDAWMDRARVLMQSVREGEAERFLWSHNFRADWYSAIETAIERKIATTDFLKAWMHLGELYGRLGEIEIFGEYFQIAKQAELDSGLSTNNRARECWFAHWITERRIYSRQYDTIRRNGVSLKIPKRKTKSGRDRAVADLVELCLDVANGKLECPLKPNFYDNNWFRLMLGSRTVDGQLQLSKSFDRIGRKKIASLVADPHISRHDLPPVNRDRFIRKNNP